jgi:hypothetical protein
MDTLLTVIFCLVSEVVVEVERVLDLCSWVRQLIGKGHARLVETMEREEKELRDFESVSCMHRESACAFVSSVRVAKRC